MRDGADLSDTQVAFGAVFDRLISDAASTLTVRDAWAPSAVRSLSEQLRANLSNLAAPALLGLYEADSSLPQTNRYRRFVEHHARSDLGELRAAFPVLDTLIGARCSQWSIAAQELIDCFDANRSALQQRLGISSDAVAVSAIAGLGDRHRSGRSVVKLRVDTDQDIIFKPRSLTSEQTFYGLWSEFRAGRGDTEPVPTVADLGPVGFMECVYPAATTDPAMYWRRAGELTGLLHLCVAEDLHYENVIAAGNQAVPIDLECIDQPNRFTEREDRLQHITDSVLATGLFPNWYQQPGADAGDSVGLFAGQRVDKIQGQMTVWHGLGTDEIEQRVVPYVRTQGGNAAVDPSGRYVTCDRSAFFQGLDAAWQHGPALVENASPWGPVRFLSRPTKDFVIARAAMLETDALQDRELFEARSAGLPGMEPALEKLLGSRRSVVVAADAAALQRLDIPLHHASETSLVLDGGTVLNDVFAETGEMHRRARLRRIDAPGRVLQERLVTLALDQFDGVHWTRVAPVYSAEPTAHKRAIEAADHLGGVLYSEALTTNEGPAWLEVNQQSPMRGTAHQTNLYAGSDGMALFFAALARVTGSETWAERCHTTLAAAPSPQQTAPWLENGWAGRIYARAIGAQLLDDEPLRRSAAEIFAAGWPEAPSTTHKLDVLGGWSGVLLALLAAQDAGVDTASRAVELSGWIAGEVERRLADPVQQASMRRMGFAHGTTGVSYGLALAAVQLDDPKAYEASVRLGQQEEQRIADRNGIPGSLQGLGADKEPTLSWCWGVSGYALARSHPAWQAVHGNASSIAKARHILMHADRDRSHACCGEAGQLMTLSALSAAKPSDQAVRDRSDALAHSLATEALEGGPWQFYHATALVTPGLYWGLAGVGYSLLHYAHPEVVPNFLMAQASGPTGAIASESASEP